MENSSDEDIRLLCKWRKEVLNVTASQTRALDVEVIKDFVHALQVQLKSAEIARGHTRLTKLICLYLDTASLARGVIASRTPSPYEDFAPITETARTETSVVHGAASTARRNCSSTNIILPRKRQRIGKFFISLTPCSSHGDSRE
jgi:hypothetical protein